MALVTILCPQTGQRVSTGIEMSRAEFEAMPMLQSRMQCWACGHEHSWSKRWATLVEEDASTRARRRWFAAEGVSASRAR